MREKKEERESYSIYSFRDLQGKIGVYSTANITGVELWKAQSLRVRSDKYFSQNLGSIWVPSSIMSSNNTKHKKYCTQKNK